MLDATLLSGCSHRPVLSMNNICSASCQLTSPYKSKKGLFNIYLQNALVPGVYSYAQYAHSVIQYTVTKLVGVMFVCSERKSTMAQSSFPECRYQCRFDLIGRFDCNATGLIAVPIGFLLLFGKRSRAFQSLRNKGGYFNCLRIVRRNYLPRCAMITWILDNLMITHVESRADDSSYHLIIMQRTVSTPAQTRF